MSQAIELKSEIVSILEQKLNAHPLYDAIQTLDDLRLFMEQHIYAVWDFMSLLKYLQGKIAPAAIPWQPHASPSTRFLINQIVLGEESDVGLPDEDGNATYVSHFELYCESMREIGADPSTAIDFSKAASQYGIDNALSLSRIPSPASAFMSSTFAFIATDKPHVVGAAFALGREHIIPEMFRAVLARMNITGNEAPAFHYYLERHIHLDDDFHAPLAMKMMNELIDGNPTRLREAEAAALAAVEARISFWDGVLEHVETHRQSQAHHAYQSSSIA